MENQTQHSDIPPFAEPPPIIDVSSDTKTEDVTQEPTKQMSTFNPEVLKSGQIMPKNIEELKGLAAAYLKSGMLPARFKNSAQVVTAYQMAVELRLPPLNALRQIAVINGTPSLFGDLPLSIALNSGLITHIEEFFVDKEYQPISWKHKNLNAEAYAAICLLKRKGSKTIREFYFTLDDAKKAGLWPEKNPDKPWAAYTKDMLKYRARSRGLKDLAADALNGLSIAEYDFNVIPDRDGDINPKDVTPTNAASELAAHLKDNEPAKTQ